MILRNTALNLAGFAVPLVISVVVIPVLIEGYGVQRFGVITILWGLLGYFGIFDLGIGKALTYAVAQIRDAPRRNEVIELTSQSSGLLTIIGIAAGLLWLLLSPTLGDAVGKGGGPDLRHEVVLAFAIASFALPLVLVSAALRGVLEAYQAFAVVMVLRILSGTLLFMAPAICLLVGEGIVGAAASLVVVRIITLAMSLGFCFRLLGRLWLLSWPKWTTVHPLLTMGGWMTISNVISPIMGYADRLILGLAAGASVTAYYATANELVTKMWLLSGALTAVLFPEFARLGLYPAERLHSLCNKAQKLVFACVFPAVLFIALFSSEILSVWISTEFAASAAPSLQILAASMLLSTMGQVPYSLVQASGRADLTAWLSLILIVPCLATIYYAAKSYGAEGVAWVWFARVATEFAVSVVFVRTIRPGIVVPSFTAAHGSVLVVGALLLAAGQWDGSIALKLTGFVVVMWFMFIVYWKVVLGESERHMLRSALRRLR